MTTYATGNPLGSTAVKDLYDNAENIDFFVNGTELAYPDRFFQTRKSWKGIEEDFQQFLLNSGYEFIGDYDADGPLNITARNQIFTKDGEYWRAAASLALPYTTVNNWVIDEPKFVSVGDAALRQDLASAAGATFVNYTAPGTGAATQDVENRLQGELWARDFGAVGDGVANDTVALQAWLNACMAQGKRARWGAGTFKITSGLLIDNGASIHYLDKAKVDLIGEGTSQTIIVYTGTGPALSVIGGKVAGTLPMQCFQQVANFTVIGAFPITAGSIGVYLDTTQHIKLSNVQSASFEWGYFMDDVDFASFHKIIAKSNTKGLFAQERDPRLTNSTRPNGLDFVGCQFGGNVQYGATFLGGACINFYGGDVEGNGIGGTGDRWGLLFEDCGVQGGVGANLNGVYFEANQGIADVWINAINPPGLGLNPPHCVHVVQSCSFNRVNNTTFTDHNIEASFDSSVAGKQKLAVKNSSFKGYGAYVPSNLRTYIHYSVDVRGAANSDISGNIMQDDLETVPQADTYFSSVGRLAVQSIASGVATDIIFDAELDDADNMHVIGSPTVITAPVTGRYAITASIYWASNATGNRSALVLRNGATEIAGATQNAVAGARTRQTVHRELNLNKGDTITLRGFQDSGGNLDADIDGTFLTVRSIP